MGNLCDLFRRREVIYNYNQQKYIKTKLSKTFRAKNTKGRPQIHYKARVQASVTKVYFNDNMYSNRNQMTLLGTALAPH